MVFDHFLEVAFVFFDEAYDSFSEIFGNVLSLVFQSALNLLALLLLLFVFFEVDSFLRKLQVFFNVLESV